MDIAFFVTVTNRAGKQVFTRADVPASQLVSVMHELSRDYRGLTVCAIVQN